MLTISSMHPCRSRRVSHAATALFLLVAAGCSIDSTMSIEGVDPAGSAAVTISGAFTTSSQGHATMLSGTYGGTSSFELAIVPTGYISPPWLIVVHRSNGRPAVGTYSLVYTLGSTVSAGFDLRGPGTPTSYVATEGELVITSSSASSVRGTLRFTGTGPDGATVTVDSEFTAMCPVGISCV